MKNIKKFENYNSSGGDNSNDIKINDYHTKKWLSYQKFKRSNIDNFHRLLKDVYKPIGHWYEKGYKKGVVGLEWDKENWSLLNRINTNYSALSNLINSLNEYISENNIGIKPFNFIENKFGTSSFWREYERMIDFLENNKQLLLKTTKDGGSKVINDTIEPIFRTMSIGDFGEDLVMKYLPKLNPNITNIKSPDESGDSEDMTKGVDIKFDFKGKTYTIQVKKIKYTKKDGDVYKTYGSSIAKKYNVDYYAFVDKYYVRFFKNYPSKIDIKWGGVLEIDKNLLSGEFRYKKYKKYNKKK
jgi:hypothetical protein